MTRDAGQGEPASGVPTASSPRSRAYRTARLGALLLVALAPAAATAHEVGLSHGVYTAEPGGLRLVLTFAEKELLVVVDGLDVDQDGKLGDADVASSSAAISRDVLSYVRVRAGEVACPLVLTRAYRVEEDGASIEARGACPAGAARYEVDLAILDRTTPGHRHLVRLERAGSTPVDLITHRADRSFSVAAAGATGDGGAEVAAGEGHASGFVGLFVSGIEHILGGLDHLLFLLGLVLVGGSLRGLIGVITAFTVAHSITLGIAVLGLWSPPGAVVEPLIALSVAYVAIENWFVKDAGKRWPLTFAFGLVHGFGFAGALGELRVPPAEVPGLLLAFNLGVELGQLAVLAVVLPVLALLRKRAGFATTGVRAVSVVLAAFGLYWFVSRVLEG